MQGIDLLLLWLSQVRVATKWERGLGTIIFLYKYFCFIYAGYNNADVMVTLPVHSANVVAMQKGIGYNQIGMYSFVYLLW